MGKMLKRLLIGLFLIAVVTCFRTTIAPLYEIRAEESDIQQGTYGDNIKWKFEDGVLTISGTGKIPNDFLEELLRGDDVKINKPEIKEIKIERGITEIWNNAFKECDEVKKVTLPQDLEAIGSYTFYRCQKLEDIKIPETVSEIGSSAFRGCGIKQINIPEQVRSIGEYTFAGCSALTKIEFPENLKSIGDYVFWNCRSIEELKVPESVSSIGYGAFNDCRNLKKIKLPDKLTIIGNDTFSGCRKLSEFQFPRSLQQIGSKAFRDCWEIKYLEVPDTVTQIGMEAFRECKGLEYIKLSKNIQVLREGILSGCSGLTSVEVPTSVLALESDVVISCKKLKIIFIPPSVVSMMKDSMRFCSAKIIGESGSYVEGYAKENGKSFLDYDKWKCDHSYSYQELKIATLKDDGLMIGRCSKCSNTILEKLGHPVSIKQKGKDLVYNGNKQNPLVEIKLANGKVLDKSYYEYQGEGNIDAGSYKTRINLKNGYEGTLEMAYKIAKANSYVYESSDKKDVLRGSYDRPFSLNVYVNGNYPKIVYKISDPKILSIDAKGKVHGKNIGSCTVTAYTEANKNYKKSNQVKVKVKIVPAKITIKSARAKSGGKISLKWVKDSKVEGYEIRYGTKKNELNAKTIRVKNIKTTSLTLKNLKRNKKYYISIHGYKKVKSGKRYREEISSPTRMTIKTK